MYTVENKNRQKSIKDQWFLDDQFPLAFDAPGLTKVDKMIKTKNTKNLKFFWGASRYVRPPTDNQSNTPNMVYGTKYVPINRHVYFLTSEEKTEYSTDEIKPNISFCHYFLDPEVEREDLVDGEYFVKYKLTWYWRE